MRTTRRENHAAGQRRRWAERKRQAEELRALVLRSYGRLEALARERAVTDGEASLERYVLADLDHALDLMSCEGIALASALSTGKSAIQDPQKRTR